MKRKRFTEKQIVSILREADDKGVQIKEISRKYGITEQTFYRWRKSIGAMSSDQLKRLKELEQENSRLKKVVANLTLDIDILKEINSKKW